MFAEQGITYDINGNIKTLRRNDSGGNLTNNFVFNYNGNQISSLVASGTQSAAFTYDANGNMTKDGRTGISTEYNILDLPQRIFAGTDEVRYIYSAAGEKLVKSYKGTLTYYRANGMMEFTKTGTAAEQLQYIKHEEGQIVKSSSGYTFHFFKTDHAGNVRAVFAENGAALTELQSVSYYPSGVMHMSNNLHLNKRLHAGKDLQNDVLGSSSVDLYDFGARYYNPLYMRWTSIDPALQFTNPYAYCANSPMIYTDIQMEGSHLLLY